jgi:hypothetical protein
VIIAFGRVQTTAWAAGNSYYVDCSAESNGDGSQESPWNTLDSVNDKEEGFSPGDLLLFKRNATCYGTLSPKGSGTNGNSITISAYGSGALPIINGRSNVTGEKNEASLTLYNQEYWHIENIEIFGGTTFGIFVNGDGSQVLHHFRITNVVVRDVYGGNMSVKTTGLIVFGYDWTQHFEDVVIDGATAHHTNMWAGIVITGKDWGWADTRSNNITIRNSNVHDTYGDGIIVFSANNVLLEHNVVYDTGNEPVETIGTPNAIWTWDCSNCVVQFNEAYENASPGWDGGAFDIDYFSSDTTVQYNYGHDNDAYCISIFASGGPVTDNIVRYNVCSNNARNADLGTDRNAELYFAVWYSNDAKGTIENTFVYNNTFYWNPANPTDHYAIAAYDLWKGCCFSGTNLIWNNIIYAANPNLLNMEMNEDVSLDYNLYWYDGDDPVEFIWGVKRYNDFETYQLESGQDAHSLFADPLLNDPTYHQQGFPTSAFTLQSGSPAIDAGADLVALGYVNDMGSHDFFGNPIPKGAYDIGAHEFGAEQQTKLYLSLVFR